MSEVAWHSASNPRPMLSSLVGAASDRKLRLFAVACCRRIWHLVPDDRYRQAVDVAEQFAEGLAAGEELDAAGAAVSPSGIGPAVTFAGRNAAYAVGWATNEYALNAATGAAESASAAAVDESVAQAALIRDIFGNPFSPVGFDPTWRTEAVVALARGMYEARDFTPMPVLADALEDAGCTDLDVLAHCRGPGSHARGCWVVDLVLGKG
jgi:hypothetical protein